MAFSRLILAALLLTVPTVALLAQASVAGKPAVVHLRTRIVDTTGAPLPGVELLVTRGEVTVLRAFSDSAGVIPWTTLEAGAYVMVARAIGRVPSADRVLLAAGDSVDADIVLFPVTPRLAKATITAGYGGIDISNRELSDFADRIQTGVSPRGSYLTPDDIARMQPPDNRSLLSRIPFVRVGQNGIRPPTIAFTRGALSFSSCKGVFFWDGVLTDPDQFVSLMDGVRPEQIGGIEIYRSSASIPARFAGTGSACGVMAVWTQLPRSPD